VKRGSSSRVGVLAFTLATTLSLARASFPDPDPRAGQTPAKPTNIVAVIPCAVAGSGPPDLALSALLVDAVSGERVPVAIPRTDRNRKGSLEVLTREIPVAGFALVTYYLHFCAQDRATKSLGHAFTTLVIRAR
jgi:hypothetical protein